MNERELTLLGACVYSVQKFEYGLYGLASHYSHISEAKNNRAFKNLDPEKFLRGDLSDFRATLGQISGTFGNEFHLKSEFLDGFLEKRNLIVHRIWRLTHDRKDEAPFSDLGEFLQDFLLECEEWIKIFRGLLSLIIEGAWIKSDKQEKFIRSEQDAECVKAFEDFLGAKFIRAKFRKKLDGCD